MLELALREVGDTQEDWHVVWNKKKLKTCSKKKLNGNDKNQAKLMKYSNNNIHNLPINSLKVNNVQGFAILVKLVEENLKKFLNPKINRTDLWRKIKQEAISQGYSCRPQTCVKSAFGGQMGIYIRIIQFIKTKEEAKNLFNLFSLFHELDLSPFLSSQRWQEVIRDRNRLNSASGDSKTYWLGQKSSSPTSSKAFPYNELPTSLTLAPTNSYSSPLNNFLSYSKVSSNSFESSANLEPSFKSQCHTYSYMTTSSDISKSFANNEFASNTLASFTSDSSFPVLNLDYSLKLINCVHQHMSDFCALLINESNYARKNKEIWCKISYEWASSIKSKNFFDPSLVQSSFKSLFDYYVNILYTVDSYSAAQRTWPLFEIFFNQYWTPLLTKEEADIYLIGREKILKQIIL